MVHRSRTGRGVALVVTSFDRVALDKPALAFVLVLTAAAIGVGHTTSSIRLLRLSEWVERRMRETGPPA